MKAIHRETGKWYAVKMIHDTKMAKPADAYNGAANGNNRATTFAREISILEKLKHSNICQLKEVFFQDGNISWCFSHHSYLFSHADILHRPGFRIGGRWRSPRPYLAQQWTQ